MDVSLTGDRIATLERVLVAIGRVGDTVTLDARREDVCVTAAASRLTLQARLKYHVE